MEENDFIDMLLEDMLDPIEAALPKHYFDGLKCSGKMVERVLVKDEFLSQWQVPKGTIVKVIETQNFGYMFLQRGQQDCRGFVIPERVFRY